MLAEHRTETSINLASSPPANQNVRTSHTSLRRAHNKGLRKEDASCRMKNERLYERRYSQRRYIYLMSSPVLRASLVAQTVKNRPEMQETQDQSLGQEDPLEKATHSSILAWRLPWTDSLVGPIHGVAKSCI